MKMVIAVDELLSCLVGIPAILRNGKVELQPIDLGQDISNVADNKKAYLGSRNLEYLGYSQVSRISCQLAYCNFVAIKHQNT